ncbi:hypothetical protein GA0070612_3635 [Micromonospora chokoriensis]|uniref:Uncharacterized protein n=1 Tax=Micromonospora chokoriensis TaxID=356851 RepID=A0A1C4XIL8_9ACTN|nr:hypothetical protein GA0070612_3635 [Micromonospora chokoriensis]
MAGAGAQIDEAAGVRRFAHAAPNQPRRIGAIT